MKKPQRNETIFESHSLKNQNGSVLLFVFIFIGFITILGIMALKSTSEDKIISSNLKKNAKSFYLAEAGIEKAKIVLQEMTLYEIYETTQANGGCLFPATALGDGNYNVELSGASSGNFNPGFTLDTANLDIETTKPQDVTIKVIASYLYYESPTHKIDVIVQISWDEGATLNTLFGGGVSSGDDTTFTKDSGSTIDFRVSASYPGCGSHAEIPNSSQEQDQRTYHTYWEVEWGANHTHKNNFIYLKAGDAFENLDGYNNQPSIKTILSDNNLLDANERIKIGDNDLLILVDCKPEWKLEDEGDYQDAILLVTFGSATEVEESREIVVRSTGQLTNGVEETIEVTVKKSNYDDLEVLSWREVD